MYVAIRDTETSPVRWLYSAQHAAQSEATIPGITLAMLSLYIAYQDWDNRGLETAWDVGYYAQDDGVVEYALTILADGYTIGLHDA